MVEHWQGCFYNFFLFPQTLQLGEAKTLTVQNSDKFLQILVLNPEASHMWADHHQLQVTANLYSTTVQVPTMREATGAFSTSPSHQIPGWQTTLYSLPQNPMGKRIRWMRCGFFTLMATIMLP